MLLTFLRHGSVAALLVGALAEMLAWLFAAVALQPLREIEQVAVVRNRWWYGFGIRIAAGFRLYNVSGLDAVELKLKSGGIRRIGTDDPQGLAAALTRSR